MTPPATAVQPSAPQQPDEALLGGGVSQVGAGWGQSPPQYVNRAIGTITTNLRPILDGNYFQNYRDFIAHCTARAQHYRTIAGTGTQAKSSCGKVRAWASCSKDKTHGKPTPLSEHCDNPECPVCWTGWAVKQSRRISERLRGYIRVARPEGDVWQSSKPDELCFQYYDPELGKFWEIGHKENAQYVRHFLISAPPLYQGKEREITPEMSTNEINAIGKFWAKWVGIRGGVMVFHPWRILPEIQERLRVLIPQGKMGNEEHERKFWQAIRENRLDLECWTRYIYWSPHFHIVGFGYVCDSPNFNKLTGWIVKEVRNVSQEKVWDGRRMKDDVAAVSYYLLSHCSVEWNKKSVGWIGCMTPNNLKRLKEAPELILYPRECEVCQAQEIIYHQTEQDWLGEPKIGREGDWQWLYFKEKLYRYHIVVWREKDARREQRRRDRERERKKAGPGPGLQEAWT